MVKVSCATGRNASCCKVEAIVTVDERGQMVLPKEVRKRAHIRAGDKFALIMMTEGDALCCLTLVKVDDLSGMVKDKLGPVLNRINK
jgi:AbrB family looped-hinge helix DNA binding protein